MKCLQNNGKNIAQKTVTDLTL